MAFGKINKNKKIRQTDLQGSEEDHKVAVPSKLIKEEEVELPEYRKEHGENNVAKSAGIKQKKKRTKLLIGSTVTLFVLALIATKVLPDKEPTQVVTDTPNEIIEHEEEIVGDTDVSGLITLKERNKDRTMIELHDDYIDLTITHPNDYQVKELSSEGINVINETIEKGTTRYSLQKNTLTGVVPIIEMRHKMYTPYTIRMQVGNKQTYIEEDEEFIRALVHMMEVEKEKKRKSNSDKKKEEKEEFYYTPYENEKIDYLNFCPVKVVEYIQEEENEEKNKEYVVNKDKTATDTTKNTTTSQTNTTEKSDDKSKEKEESKEQSQKVESTEKEKAEVPAQGEQKETETAQTLGEFTTITKEIDIGDGTIIKYLVKQTPMPCDSEQYLQNRLAFDLPMGYKVIKDNALEHKQVQAQKVSEGVKEKTVESITNTEDSKDVTNKTKEEVSTEVTTNGVTEGEPEVDKEEEQPKPELVDSKGNEILNVNQQMLELFADISETDKDINSLEKEYDYSTFMVSDREVTVNSLVLENNGVEIKYYEFKFMLGGNETYIAVYGEVDDNINYILEDIRYLIDSLRFG